MPPNAAEPPVSTETRLVDYFWTCDRRGMDLLLSRVRSSFEALERIYTLYTRRAQLELDFGTRLRQLQQEVIIGETLASVDEELNKASQSHLDLSNRLENQVTPALQEWCQAARERLDDIEHNIETIYKERQDTIHRYIKVRDQYQSTQNPSKYLEREHHGTLQQVKASVEEWTLAWRDACEQLEALEEERVEMLANNVWDYANLCSARLLVQDEYCEKIRKELEEYNVCDEIRRYIEQDGTKGAAPEAADYIEFFGPQENIINKRLPPRPRTTSSTSASSTSTLPTNSGTQNQVKRKPLSKNGNLEELLARLEISNNNASDKVAPASAVSERRTTASSTGSLRASSTEISKGPPKSPRPVSQQLQGDQTLTRTAGAPIAAAVSTSGYSETSYSPQHTSYQAQPQQQQLQQQQQAPQPQTSQPIYAQSYAHQAPVQQSSPLQQIPQQQSQASQSQQQSYHCQPAQSTQHNPPASPYSQHQQAYTYAPQYSSAPQSLPPPSPHMMAMAPRSPTLPPPLSIPTSASVHSPVSPMVSPMVSPCPSPSMVHSNPSYPTQPPPQQQQPRPACLPDGRPVMYWVRAKYDYGASDETELSFQRGNLFAVTGLSMDEGWWIADRWDETWQCSTGSGCIPSNFMMTV
ncbi:hypothetical protein BCR43DRAFT_525689 [Syncephalastrum racemosum]|uniref:SH3 domain-containing protein n=1 Tax=Syncephalastrum racemosum TaxID=13706 RepID=A0A1X2H7D4_SYNRA|nr:hypothetical protein BCR43DRAFT_525689 [Syncephalastrum racemosum]